MTRANRLMLAAASFVLAGLAAGPASANGSDSRACEDSAILSRIVSKFRHQTTHVPNLPDVEIVDFDRIHQHRYLPFGEDQPIARRYCGATAVMSDGGRRDIWYLIESPMGFASIGDGVEFCVAGFDRWYVYNGYCRVLR